LLIAVTVAAVGGNQGSPPGKPWPPGVQQVPDSSSPLSPEDALKTFYLAPGYRLELAASEPLVQDPVAIDWDVQGRLWGVEMPGYMRDVAGGNEHDPIGRIVVLEDTNDDGKMDKRTVFADGLVLARALKVLDHGVLVGEPPNVWLMHDTNGDLHMDSKELVTNEFGQLDGDPQNNANGLFWAMDNRLYTAGQVDIFLQYKHRVFSVQKTLLRGEWGVSQDDAGRIFRNTNSSAVHVDLVPTPYFARHKSLIRTRGSYEALSADDDDLNTVWPVRPNPGTNRAYQAGIDRPDGTLASYTAVCAPLVYRGDRLPAELYGNLFVAEPAANLVSRIVLTDDGTTLKARKAYERAEFLASTDERFRPVYLSNAPDGTMYVVDMYRGILEHRNSLTIYLRDQILKRNLVQPAGFGRIYRVVHETTKRDTTKDLASASAAQLVTMLAHPNGWRRDTAQRLLVERSDRPAQRPTVAALVRLASTAPDWRTRLHALWTLDGIDAVRPASVMRALEDPSREVRAAALRLAERWLGSGDRAIETAVLKRLDDSDWAVREQLAATLGTLPQGSRETAIARALERHGSDPVVMDAALSGVRGSEAAVLEKLLNGSEPPTSARDAAITMLTATIIRSGAEPAVQDVLARTGEEARPEWQRSAMMRGAEVALLGIPMPGTPQRRSAARGPSVPVPCPTCPGGRAGPGGAYAFEHPQPASPGQAPYGGANGGEPAAFDAGARGGPGVRLKREPASLLKVAGGDSLMATRAAAVLARLDWPEKPGGSAAVAPLTTDERLAFDQGKEVYRNICQACHQPDGRGQDRVAPSLVGSSLALAQPGIPTRILLNGKEGPIGLMPAIGTVLSDDQIAGVLTYIRREWGQTGT
ncbi:MAG TPA: c-type cytochrome, partial [Vicinamibacterales bacterium]|nr:c-type cytochrome [Vicinamibacterales bacterium]